MKIRSIDELQDAIDDDYTWRFREINIMKDELDRVKDKGKKVESLARATIILAYAHWEGFVKSSTTFFFEYLKRLSLNRSQLSDKFYAASLRHICDGRNMADAVEEIKKCLIDPSYKFQYNETVLVSTESNLNYSVLTKIANNIGLDISPLESKRQLLDAKILGERNKCAHGEKVYTDFQSGMDIADAAISLMQLFKTQMQNMIANKEFRASDM